VAREALEDDVLKEVGELKRIRGEEGIILVEIEVTLLELLDEVSGPGEGVDWFGRPREEGGDEEGDSVEVGEEGRVGFGDEDARGTGGIIG